MKNNTFHLSARTGLGILFLLLASSLVLTSCKKDKEEATVTEEEAAEVIMKSVESGSGGMQSQIEEIAQLSETYASPTYCGLTDSDTVNNSASNGSITFNQLYYWQWVVSCTNNVPSSIAFQYNGHCDYDAPRMSSDDQVSCTATVSGLNAASENYVVNLNLQRDGSQQSKIQMKRSFESDLTVTISNVEVNKNTYQIASGSATASISGQSSTGESFSFQGSIVFLGNGTATLTMPSGAQYTISL